MKVKHHKKISQKRKESFSSSDQSVDDKQHIKVKKAKSQLKKKLHSSKHRHKKRRHRSSSSDSSSSVDSASSSTDSTDSSSSSEDQNKKRKQNSKSSKSGELNKNQPESLNKSNDKQDSDDEPTNDIPLELMGAGRSMAPMTKEEWDKKQSVVKGVYDESTGRHRLIKGDGEVIEEIVSKERHKQINQQATKGDGEYFQKHLKQV